MVESKEIWHVVVHLGRAFKSHWADGGCRSSLRWVGSECVQPKPKNSWHLTSHRVWGQKVLLCIFSPSGDLASNNKKCLIGIFWSSLADENNALFSVCARMKLWYQPLRGNAVETPSGKAQASAHQRIAPPGMPEGLKGVWLMMRSKYGCDKGSWERATIGGDWSQLLPAYLTDKNGNQEQDRKMNRTN